MKDIEFFKNKYLKYKHKYLECCDIDDSKLVKAIAFFDKDIKGTVLFEEQNLELVKVTINLSGFVPNTYHGFHVHESGDLTKGCDSMCSHFNPTNKNHGGREDVDRHVGDLGNIYANDDGIVITEFVDKIIKLRGNKANIIGRGLIIHHDIDDLGKGNHELSLTTGNSGLRIACSIIGYKSVC